MKRRRLEQIERRRPVAELNLLGETKRRLVGARRGCLSLFSSLLVILLTLVVLGAGLR